MCTRIIRKCITYIHKQVWDININVIAFWQMNQNECDNKMIIKFVIGIIYVYSSIDSSIDSSIFEYRCLYEYRWIIDSRSSVIKNTFYFYF